MTDSRRKGRVAERELEQLIADRGIEVDRSLGGRQQPYGDIRIPGVAIECRRRERVEIIKWSRDHEAQVPDHLTPAVAYRTNGEPWRVSLPLADYLDLVEQAGS
jgi:Holliday junction resolvase